MSFIHSKNTPREAVREKSLSALCNSDASHNCYTTATIVRKTNTSLALETLPNRLPTDWTTANAGGGTCKEPPPKTDRKDGRKEGARAREGEETFITKCKVLNMWLCVFSPKEHYEQTGRGQSEDEVLERLSDLVRLTRADLRVKPIRNITEIQKTKKNGI